MSTRTPGGRFHKPIASDPAHEIDSDGDAAAPWWSEALAEAAFDRRHLATWAVLSAGPIALPTLPGCAGSDAAARDQSEQEAEVAALDLQRREGWNAGMPEDTFELAGAVDYDVDQGQRWQALLPDLATVMQPSQPQLVPWSNTALFQSLKAPGSESLREAITPVSSPAMEAAYDKGRSLLSLFRLAAQGGAVPLDTAVVIDVAGPEAVAVAAGLAERFDPVFWLDNWPHPAGVVPAEQTLGAALFFAPWFERAAAGRVAPAPPAFVLDGSRLTPYSEDQARFDNRYTASLPDAAALQQLGVHHVLYVNAAPSAHEADDLNEAFVALEQGGVDVRAVSLSDFVPLAPGAEAAAAPADATDDEGAIADDGVWPYCVGLHYYWGGTPWYHGWFWRHYGWYRPRLPLSIRRWGRVGPPPVVGVGWGFRVAPRATLFTGFRMPGRVGLGPRPPHFGAVHIGTSRTTGRFTGLRGGFGGRVGGWGWGGAGRSGSMGRMGGGGWGG